MDKNVVPLVFETYQAIVKNSVGSNLFRNFYAKVHGKKTDIMNDGDLSCAFFVSSILTLLGFIKGTHGTVDATVRDLRASGWKAVRTPKAGSVLVWEQRNFGKDNSHKHIGFFIGNGLAVSNISAKKQPRKHPWNFQGKRKVDLILWHPKLNKNK